MRHLYRKAFNHAFEAEETAKGFFSMPNIDHLDDPEVSVAHEGGKHYVYVALKGDVDPGEVLAATGYERIS
jgi:hypothetical protein